MGGGGGIVCFSEIVEVFASGHTVPEIVEVLPLNVRFQRL